MITELLLLRRLALGVGAVVVSSSGSSVAMDEEAFAACVTDLRTHLVEERAHEPALVDHALDDARFLPRLIELDRAQPEFVQTFWDYLDDRVTRERIERGQRKLEEHAETLWQVHADYGVSPRYLVALWGMETHYGAYFGRVSVVDALVTLTCDGRREAFFRRELDALLHVMRDNHLERDELRGSWAGAMGHTQFMPTTFREHAVDYDGSGRVDLWNSLPDAFASSARYLRAEGWEPGQRWGREVTLADNFDYALVGLDERRSLDEWHEAGVRRADGNRLPPGDTEGSVLLPMGRSGPAFLVYKNFRVLMQWNASVSYALATGHLADRLDGQPELRAERTAEEIILSREEAKEVQDRLRELGYDPGPTDGLIGPQTRQAVRAFQQDRDLPADGYPDRDVMERLLEG